MKILGIRGGTAGELPGGKGETRRLPGGSRDSLTTRVATDPTLGITGTDNKRPEDFGDQVGCR